MFLWDYLKTISAPILIYGTGNGAEKILAMCQSYGIQIAGIFASDNHTQKNLFCGYSVMRRCEIPARYSSAVILLAFGTYQDAVLTQIQALSQQYEVLVPDLPLTGGASITPNYLKEHSDDLAASRSLLCDEKSRRVFDVMLHAKLTGSLDAHFREDTRREDDMMSLRLGFQERFLDLGAYSGDTISEFLRLTGRYYCSIDAFEPDPHNFSKLKSAVSALSNVTLHPAASWCEATTLTFTGKGGRNCAKRPDLPGKYTHLHEVAALPVDSLQTDFSYVKMDVEGAEAETLLGMRQTLTRCHPKLCISAYHKPDDFITLPRLLNQLCPGYKMYLRRNRCLPAWEIQLYAVWA